MGFGVPLHDWLRGPLREWAEAKLEPSRIARHGVFDTTEVTPHLAGAFAGVFEQHRDALADPDVRCMGG